MVWSFLSGSSPARVVALDNHESPSLIGSPPGSAIRADHARPLASSNNNTKTAKKEKKKTAREEKKMAAAKKKKRFESDSESSDSSWGQAKARVQNTLMPRQRQMPRNRRDPLHRANQSIPYTWR